ncbi:MAG: TIGR03936 family radical SAM-associated protein [Chloroflexota bacterium]|nr:TIGR03936 family radical SAM-associated protein [Chloroflexota bacterium]
MDDRSGRRSAEPRQRWRIVFARAAPLAPEHADGVAAWEASLGAAGLPLAFSLGRTARARVAIAASLPLGIAGEAELADVVLTERLTRHEVWSRLDGQLPSGHHLVDLFDVWLGEPSLAARLAAADYRLDVQGAGATELTEAGRTLLGSTALPRTRPKGEGRSVEYDLRPLLLGLHALPGTTLPGTALPGTAPSSPANGVATVHLRLRQAQEGGAGRPDEVVLALGEQLGRQVTVASVVRERLLTSDELPPG